MTPSSSTFSDEPSALVELVHRAQDGCEESAQQLFETCRGPLLAVIRRVIHRRLRTLYDSDDFLLAAFTEIFSRHFSDEVLQSPARFWPYLKRIAENKVLDARKKHLVAKRSDLRRQVSIEALGTSENGCSDEIDPCDALILKELVLERLACLINELPDMLQAIVRKLLNGEGVAEIADGLGVEPKRVYRAMEWLRKKILES